MKKIRHILIAVALISTHTLCAQSLPLQTEIEFQSTSAMQSCGSDLPMAAVDGVIMAQEYGGGSSSTEVSPSGPRRLRDKNPGEPGYDTPVGDIPVMFMVLLATLVIVGKSKKQKQVS